MATEGQDSGLQKKDSDYATRQPVLLRPGDTPLPRPASSRQSYRRCN